MLSLTFFIHSVLFSINTHPFHPLLNSSVLCIYINSPFVVPIMIISPAALSFYSFYSSPFQSFAMCSLYPSSPSRCISVSSRMPPSLLQGWIIPVSACLVTFGPPARLSRTHHTAMALAGLTSRLSAKGLWCPWRRHWPVPHSSKHWHHQSGTQFCPGGY